jgi:hypothetical protein
MHVATAPAGGAVTAWHAHLGISKHHENTQVRILWCAHEADSVGVTTNLPGIYIVDATITVSQCDL